MNLEIDGVAKEYMVGCLWSLFYGPDQLFDIELCDSKTKEECFVSLLQSGVRMGALSYQNDQCRKLHRFLSTDKLIRHWGWFFPGAELTASREDRFEVKLSKAGRKLFKGNWQTEGEEPPPWPGEKRAENVDGPLSGRLG